MTHLLWNMVLFVCNIQWKETDGQSHCACCDYVGTNSHLPFQVWWAGL